ncbi:general odorant-binding protein 99a-like [Uranotaenia lowii]|uniref:general odorant-binding protein 99a-like n=1 Tax=Uranotaenia lowii TaxID=190385 RepID=UPI00247B09F1|nr:general odorant-binding protein 99a-like [Uranotaenia lowii]
MASWMNFCLVTLLVIVGMARCEDEDAGKQQHLKIKETCAKLLSVPEEMRTKYFAHEYPEEHDTYCFIRCVSILHDNYDDETGPNFESIHRWFNDGTALEDFTTQHQDCAERGNEVEEGKKPCKCRKAFRTMMCFRDKLHNKSKA